jgi:hypothetical protein
MVLTDQHEHLFAQQPDVLSENVDLLQRAVVEVEPEPDEQPLVGRGKVAAGRFTGWTVGAGDRCAWRRYADSTVSVATIPLR